MDEMFGVLPFLAQCVASLTSIAMCVLYVNLRAEALAAKREMLSLPLSEGEGARYRYHSKRYAAVNVMFVAFVTLAAAGVIARLVTHAQFPGQLALLAVVLTLTIAHSFQRAEDQLLNDSIG